MQDVFVQDPPSPTTNHYGSRVVPDGAGHLFVTTGEHYTLSERQLAQDLDTTYGKVVRVNLDGTPPADNPFAGDAGRHPRRSGRSATATSRPPPSTPDGQLWAVEHGPKGGDELNRIEPGGNYGWPVISYGENYNGSPVGEGITAREGMEQPRYYWDPVIAPSGMAFYDGAMFPEWHGDLLVGSLNPGALVRLQLDGDKVVGEERLLTDAGRIRDVAVAPDGAVLVLTDADDGALLRADPRRPHAKGRP